MNGKTILLLIITALVGIALGAWGIRQVETSDMGTRILSALHLSRAPSRTETPPATGEPADHAGHDEHDHKEHGHDDDKVVRLNADKIKQLGIEVAGVQAGSLHTSLTLPGIVALNTDRRIHIVPRIPGVVREIRVNLGDQVRAGEIMAVIESRELADSKAAYLAARERVTLAETTFAREQDLWEKKISPAEDYLKAKQALAEVRIELRVAAQKLLALGFSETSIKQLVGQPDADRKSTRLNSSHGYQYRMTSSA